MDRARRRSWSPATWATSARAWSSACASRARTRELARPRHRLLRALPHRRHRRCRSAGSTASTSATSAPCRPKHSKESTPSSTSRRSPTTRSATRSRTSRSTSTTAPPSRWPAPAKRGRRPQLRLRLELQRLRPRRGRAAHRGVRAGPLTAYATLEGAGRAGPRGAGRRQLHGHEPPLRDGLRHERPAAPRPRAERLRRGRASPSATITILSDGTPWRPLIHVRDMARAIDWALDRRGRSTAGPSWRSTPARDEWNYQIRELADAVADDRPGRRGERPGRTPLPTRARTSVSFARFRELAPEHQPEVEPGGGDRGAAPRASSGWASPTRTSATRRWFACAS